ncbi:XK-related protein 6-like [Babylonia areolata]|uniref:XK-related protein 6-like n=1 Tax=Babylonia areolata TaxID=304850 RepID=UPI003FD26B71
MEGTKALLSRRSSSNREHYLSVFTDDECDIELGSTTSEDESVFYSEDNRAKERQHGKVIDGRHVQPSRSSTSAESKTKKSRSYGSDHVDMPINSSKDVAKGYKRRTSENREIVYDFSWFDILIGVTSIIIYFVDIASDIKMAVDYFLDLDWMYGSVTTALIVGPSLVTCCFGLHWYIIDYKTEKKVISKNKNKNKNINHMTPSYVWFFRFFFTALQFGPVVRTIEYLHYGCMSRSQKIDDKSRRRFHWWMLYEDVDNCLLRLFESFLESAPQLTWQLYITITLKPEDNAIGTTTRTVALLSSWASLAVSLVSYHRSLRNSREDKQKMTLLSMPSYFLWRACETGARVLCIAMFASAFQAWVFGIILFHWVVISVWLMNQRTTFYAQRCLEKVFNIICGYVMLFCFLNLREGHTRYRFLIFYIIFYTENFFMLAFWFRFTPDLGAWFHIWGFIVVLIFFVLHIAFQLLYYSCFHPSDSIIYCLSCDKYSFYESVCYDVRPELDDGVGSPNARYTSKEMLADSSSVPRLIGNADGAGDGSRRFDDISIIVESSERQNGRAEQGISNPKQIHARHCSKGKTIEHHARVHDIQ